ncbi:hypothetical protein C8F01DRAFT_177148 [Mycena amicta]|nr:hypothetical protein C8F01DRAFT_177148 [Mycena amicta]
MHLPQELLESIVDQIAPLHEWPSSVFSNEEDLKTLHTCSLVSRAFVRSCQLRLFAGIGFRDPHFGSEPHSSYTLFSDLISRSPHISAYVRHLHVVYHLADAVPLANILCTVTNLRSINLYPVGTPIFLWDAHPTALKEAFYTALSRPTLSRINMVQYKFADAAQLHGLLRNAVGLKQLEMLYIRFEGHDFDSEAADLRPDLPIVLDSLLLRDFSATDLASIQRAFTSFDLAHLRTIHAMGTPITALLCENAATLREVEVMCEGMFTEPEDVPIGPMPNLTSITIQAPASTDLFATLRLFSLDATPSLITLNLDVWHNIYPADASLYARLSSTLADYTLPALRTVQITADKYAPKPRRWMIQPPEPAVAPQSQLPLWMSELVQRREGVLCVNGAWWDDDDDDDDDDE